MPTARSELRIEFGTGNEVACKYLFDNGARLTPEFIWIIPKGIEFTPKMRRAVKFLIEEWDYSGVVIK